MIMEHLFKVNSYLLKVIQSIINIVQGLGLMFRPIYSINLLTLSNLQNSIFHQFLGVKITSRENSLFKIGASFYSSYCKRINTLKSYLHFLFIEFNKFHMILNWRHFEIMRSY